MKAGKDIVFDVGEIPVILGKNENDSYTISTYTPEMYTNDREDGLAEYFRKTGIRCDQEEFIEKISATPIVLSKLIQENLSSEGAIIVPTEEENTFQIVGGMDEEAITDFLYAFEDGAHELGLSAKAMKKALKNVPPSSEPTQRRFQRSISKILDLYLTRILPKDVAVDLYKKGAIEDLWNIANGKVKLDGEVLHLKEFSDLETKLKMVDVATRRSMEDFVHDIPGINETKGSKDIQVLLQPLLVDGMLKKLSALVCHYFCENSPQHGQSTSLPRR